MTSKFIFFENVTFSYDAMSHPILQDFNASFCTGWTGIVGANGAGKTTVLNLAGGLTEPVKGRVQVPGPVACCAQRTDSIPHRFEALVEAGDPFACRLKGELRIESGWVHRWESLSHGERKRAQIAAALWQEPAVLALDEPTNHIDADARQMLLAILSGYGGIGLLVSHDRELLNTLCHHCLFLDPPDAVLRPGNYAAGKREAAREQAHLQSRKKMAKQHAARLKKEAHRRLLLACKADRSLSKRHLAARDHDTRARIDLARITGTDGRAGKYAGQMRARSEQAIQEASAIKVRKSYELGIWIEGERCRRDLLFRLPAGALQLGKVRTLRHPDLNMLPGDRIALTGTNGSGKSTLVQRILRCSDLPSDRLTYLPQEIDLPTSQQIVAAIRMQPPGVLGNIMTIVSRLGSRPANLLSTTEPSPGELRKLLLALGIALRPHLIVMDEPTNHLDLPSIECLEEALSDCPCGMLLVSHDEQLLQRLTRTRWHIENADPSEMILKKM